MITLMLTSIFITACSNGNSNADSSGVQDEGQSAVDEEASDCLYYILLDDGTYGVGMIDSLKESEEYANIVIPSTYQGKHVTQILSSGFAGTQVIKTVQLPDTMVIIGPSAFQNCRNLESINIPYGVTTIGTGAFWYCDDLEGIEIPDSVLYIQGRAFRNSGIKTLTLSKSLKVISPEAFYSCSLLESVIIPEGVTQIYDKAFCECISLKEVYLPKSLETVGTLCFDCCYKMRKMYYAGTDEDFRQIENYMSIMYEAEDLIYNTAP